MLETNYVLHPAVVHFPIGLLTVYTFLELLRFRFLLDKRSFFYVKAVFVMLGSLAGLPTILLGAMNKHLAIKSGMAEVVNMHALFAVLSIVIFSIIAVAYLIVWVKSDASTAGFVQKIWFQKAALLAERFLRSPFVVFVAIVGACALTIAGALGASMVHGPKAEPFVEFVYSLFFDLK